MKNMKKLFALILCAAMVLALLPVLGQSAPAALAADADKNGLDLEKTAVFDNETGTYTLTLESFVTGTALATTEEKELPLDIALVLDVSGSMDESISVGTVKSASGLDSNAEEGWYTFDFPLFGEYKMRYNTSSDKWEYYQKILRRWTSTDADFWGNIIGSSDVQIDKINALKLGAYRFAQTIYNDAVKAESGLEHRISVIKFADDSYPNGNDYITKGNANYLKEGNSFTGSYNRTEVVKNLTAVNTAAGLKAVKDAIWSLSAAGATAADYGMTLAKEVLSQDIVTSRESGKAVLLFTDGEPNHGSGFSTTVATDTVKKAKEIKDIGGKVYTLGVFKSPSNNVQRYMDASSSNKPAAMAYSEGSTDTMNATGGYFYNATTSQELTTIFQTAAQQIIEEKPSMALSSSAVLVDIISDYFEIPSLSGTNVTTYTANCTGISGGKLTFDAKTPATGLTVTTAPKTSDANDTITVTGFDYAANWCGNHGTESSPSYSGKKLIVVITGLVPNAAAYEEAEFDPDNLVPTNTAESGIYNSDGELVEKVEAFVSPEVEIEEPADQVWVLDYAKTAETPPTAGYTGLKGAGSKEDAAANTFANVSGDYGSFAITASKITYTPNTASWTGEDSYYAVALTSTGYTMQKVIAKAASNVYYEDDFVAAEDKDGIVFTGTWSDDGTAVTNDYIAADNVEGWVSSLADDKAYSGGSAKKADEKGASAAITFTGTGIDVYTRTTSKTGTVFAVLKNSEGGLEKYFWMDNKALSNGETGYYQVPTLSLNDLEYGTYTLTITVTDLGKDFTDGVVTGTRTTYYIDGFRVYTPAEQEVDFVSVKDLIDDTATNKVFVDEDADGASGVVALADAGDYMAENEVYLKDSAAITFKVATGAKYYIGMKNLTGASGAAVAKFTKGTGTGTATIDHTTDLYYELTPDSDGKVTIKNDGNGILALTKLQMVPTAESAVSAAVVGGEEGLMAAKKFAVLCAMTEPEEAEAPVEAIEEPAAEPEIVVEQPEAVDEAQQVIKLVKSIIGSFRKLLKH